MPPQTANTAHTNSNSKVTSSSPNQPIITSIQQTPAILSAATIEPPATAQIVTSRKRARSGSLMPRKQRRKVLLDITNVNLRREGTNKRIIKESALQKAAREERII